MYFYGMPKESIKATMTGLSLLKFFYLRSAKVLNLVLDMNPAYRIGTLNLSICPIVNNSQRSVIIGLSPAVC